MESSSTAERESRELEHQDFSEKWRMCNTLKKPDSEFVDPGMLTWITQLSFSPDNKTIAACFFMQRALDAATTSATLWNAETGEQRITFGPEPSNQRTLCFSPNGNTILMGFEGNETLGIWDAGTGELQGTLAGHAAAVTSFQFSPDGRTILSGSKDSILNLWDAGTGELQRTFGEHMTVNPSDRLDCFFSSNGKTIASCFRGRIKLWSVQTGEPQKIMHALRNNKPQQPLAVPQDEKVLHAYFSSDRSMLLNVFISERTVSNPANSTLKLWQRHTSAKDSQDIFKGNSKKTFCSLKHELPLEITTAILELLVGWHLKQTFAEPKSDDVLACRFPPDGKTILCYSSNRSTSGLLLYSKSIKVWDTETGALRQTLEGPYSGYRLSSDGKILATTVSRHTEHDYDGGEGNNQTTIQLHRYC